MSLTPEREQGLRIAAEHGGADLRDAMEEIDRLRTENYWIIKNSSDELDEQEAHWKQRVSELERAIPVVTDGRFNAASAIQHLKDCAEWERMEDEGG